jgi:hypothetical protein
VRGLGDAVYAVNCGGEAHTDLFGIKYEKDTNNKVGTPSDYGKQLMIGEFRITEDVLSMKDNLLGC